MSDGSKKSDEALGATLALPPARDRVLSTTELRDAILGSLPTQKLYQARRVCRKWRHAIDASPTFRQLMFVSASWRLPKAPIEKVVRLGDFAIELNPIFSCDFLLQANKDAVVHTTLDPFWHLDRSFFDPILENLLATELVSVIEHENYQSGAKTTTTFLRLALMECNIRPLFGLSTNSPDAHEFSILSRGYGSTAAQWNWQRQLISKPPIEQMILKLDYGLFTSTTAKESLLHFRRRGGLRFQDILVALDTMKHQAGDDWLVYERGKSRLPTRFAMLVPLRAADGRGYASVNGKVAWRMLKTRLWCLVAEESLA